jgi:multiple sugar transport system permease protein
MKKSERWLPYIFLLPTVIVMLVLVIYPLFFSVRISFSDFSLGLSLENISFVGFKNFAHLFKDSYFLNGLRLTLYYIVGTSFAAFILGFGISLLIQRHFIGKKIIMNFLILPMATTPLVVGIIWRLLFAPDISIINYFLSLININGPEWLSSPIWAFVAIIIAYIWEWTPFFIIMLSAGIASLPNEPFEAALIDGAGFFQVLRYLTIPLLKPIIFLVLFIRTMDAFRSFDVIYGLTRGGPGRSTQILGLVTYNTGLVYLQLGYASAMALFMLLIVTLAIIFLLRFVRTSK